MSTSVPVGAYAPSGLVRGRSIDRAQVGTLVGLLLQVTVLLLLIIGLRIENPAFYQRIAPLALGGAVVNHLLPLRHRLRFFALLSMAGMWLVFGIVQGTWILGIGFTFIVLCHLPVHRRIRLALVLAAATGLVLMRANYVASPWEGAIWPVVGSLLMFRLIVYLYDLPHLKERTTWEQRVAYFFCLPNVVFPLFPVIDFSTFRRTYYDRPAAEIYQEGIHWILRGLVHLVGYRLIYQYGTLSPAEVRSGSSLIVYLVANYGLYLRVSGQFHLITGVLHLFGFRLPETHRFFFLAANFSDLWRRINIYWKDFMQKVFYMPMFFRLMRGRGETFAMVVSTIFVFVATWLFHSYQWFWLLGTWLWSATDTLFWAILGVCLIVNSLYEARKGRVRSVGVPRLTARRMLRNSVQTVAMFTFMSLLWALWTSPTFGDFANLLRNARFGGRDIAVLAGVWLAVGVLATAMFRRAHAAQGKSTTPRWLAAGATACLAVIPLSEVTRLRDYLPEEARVALSHARDTQLNKRDQEQLQRGYYEKIVGVNRFNNELWRVYSLRPASWTRLDSTGAVRQTSDDRLVELVPGFKIGNFHGAPLTVNSTGLRDREYSLAKPVDVFRIVVMGQSYVLGEGVKVDETFENVLEDRLNTDLARSLGYSRIEIINLAAPAYTALQQSADLAMGRVAQWSPDVVLCVGHYREFPQLDNYFRAYLRQRDAGSWSPHMAEWIERAGLSRDLSAEEIGQRLDPFRAPILSATYVEMVRRIRALGALPVFAYIPTPDTRVDAQLLEAYLASTKDAQFPVALDFGDVYDLQDQKDLVVAEWDHHPNARGHRLIAAKLYEVMRANPTLLQRAADTRKSIP
ncbi:MAG: hypothetical protein ABIZ91_19930 [Gemmatimonadaceae bacterium]